MDNNQSHSSLSSSTRRESNQLLQATTNTKNPSRRRRHVLEVNEVDRNDEQLSTASKHNSALITPRLCDQPVDKENCSYLSALNGARTSASTPVVNSASNTTCSSTTTGASLITTSASNLYQGTTTTNEHMQACSVLLGLGDLIRANEKAAVATAVRAATITRYNNSMPRQQVDAIVDATIANLPRLPSSATRKSRTPRTTKRPEHLQYFEITDKDVIFGRGNGPSNHNTFFREKVVLHRQAYRDGWELDKKVLTKQLYEWVHDNGGHFLAKDSSTNRWYEVTKQAAFTKIRQMIREHKTAEERHPKQQAQQEAEGVQHNE